MGYTDTVHRTHHVLEKVSLKVEQAKNTHFQNKKRVLFYVWDEG